MNGLVLLKKAVTKIKSFGANTDGNGNIKIKYLLPLVGYFIKIVYLLVLRMVLKKLIKTAQFLILVIMNLKLLRNG